MIELSAVHKRYGQVVALRGLDLAAPDATITGLLGPNGAGKTTALRVLAGTCRADAGRVEIDGIDLVRQPERARRRLGLLPDGQGLYARLTAREHLAYVGRLRGLDKRAITARSDDLLDRLHMGALGDRRAAGYSQGERTKLCLAMALIHDPRNVVLDEPTNGLDVMSTRVIRALVSELRERGQCVVFSSHQMSEVAEVCDRVVVIAGGRSVATGSPNDLLAQTSCENLEDAFVALISPAPSQRHDLSRGESR